MGSQMQVSFAQSSKAVLDHVVWTGVNTPSIHKRCVIYPEQKDIVFTTLLTLRKIAYLPKDIENRILAYILRDQVSPGKILSHFLQGSQKSDFIKSILTHIGINVD